MGRERERAIGTFNPARKPPLLISWVPFLLLQVAHYRLTRASSEWINSNGTAFPTLQAVVEHYETVDPAALETPLLRLIGPTASA